MLCTKEGGTPEDLCNTVAGYSKYCMVTTIHSEDSGKEPLNSNVWEFTDGSYFVMDSLFPGREDDF